MSGNAGTHLACIMKQAISLHEEGPCKFKEGALERILNSPEFAALSQRIEDEEEICPLRDVQLVA